MEKEYKSNTQISWKNKSWKRLLCLFLTLVSLIGLLPMDILAAWDGQGSGTGGGSTMVNGNHWLLGDTPEQTIIGYRFSVYSEAGVKLGYSIDVEFTNKLGSTTLGNKRFSLDTKKKSHIDLFRAYATYKQTGNPDRVPSIGPLGKETAADSAYHFNATDIEYKGSGAITMASTHSDPTKMQQWIEVTTIVNGEEEHPNTDAVVRLCGAGQDYVAGHSFIIVEPLFYVVLEGENEDTGKLQGLGYGLTMAELAVYQAYAVEQARKAQGLSDTNGWTNITPYGPSINEYVNTMGRFNT